MKIKISTNSLLEALKSVSLPVGRSLMAAIPNVLISAPRCQGGQAGSVTLACTNTDHTIVANVPARVEEAGRAAIPAKQLLTLVNKLTTQSVVISTDAKHNANIAAGAARYQLRGSDPVNYPAFPIQAGQTFTMSQAALKTMLSRTVFCASEDESHYVINSVCLDFSPSGETKGVTTLTAIGTDLCRVATAEVTVPGSLTGPGTAAGIIVPRTAALKIRDALTDDGEVTVQYDSTRATFAIVGDNGTVNITTLLVGGNYPKYKDVIPGNRPAVVGIPPYTPTKVTVNRGRLLRALQRVGRMANPNAKMVSLHCSHDTLTISASGIAGDATEKLGIKFTGIQFATKINPEYITSALKVVPGDVVELLVTNGVEPVVMKSTFPFIYVAMPMRTSS